METIKTTTIMNNNIEIINKIFDNIERQALIYTFGLINEETKNILKEYIQEKFLYSKRPSWQKLKKYTSNDVEKAFNIIYSYIKQNSVIFFKQ